MKHAIDLNQYMTSSDNINFTHPAVAAKARELASGCSSDTEIARRCFEFVRDEIRHTGDTGEGITTCSASEVLEEGAGWCYAKSHLLAALLRANGIPAALCYQRLNCSEYTEGVYCLHGLNAVYLKDFGWYRVDARGNKAGVDAQFDPPYEKLAFELGKDEYDLPQRYAEPLDVVVEALKTRNNYRQMVGNFPDYKG
jgi:transglutaminase-like putative cysteine protease